MDKTPISKYNSAARRVTACPTDVLRRKEELNAFSPTVDALDSENDDSFTQIASTQEGCENIDVIWDWNSPQAKQRPKRSQKRLHLPQSPKIPIKRHPSNHSIQDFEKLREELRLLRDEIAKPDHEDLLQLSPVEEAEYKSIHISDGDAYLSAIEQENFPCQPVSQELISNDLFDDSFDDQLIACSQRIESHLQSNSINKPVQGKSTDFINRHASPKKSTRLIIANKTVGLELPRVERDTFEDILKGVTFENVNSSVSSSYSADNRTGKVEFHRTKSFEMSTMNNFSGKLDKTKLDEIERKRKEALAKLELKKKQGFASNSPVQCSINEIEQKRLQALAKREAKRQQDLIEQKRQEAVKRLEMSRKKNATAIKSSLSNRLN